jgi:UDP-glucuronate 4-epimerase
VQLKRARQAHAASLGVYIADGDINDAALMARLFAACRPTHVVHMAAQAGVRHAASHPLSYVHSNLAGHVGVLEAVRAASPPPALIFASSSSVYGLNAKLPFSEGDRVDAPASLYAATKRADELLAHAYHNVHGLDVTALRFFTVFGPWGRPDMAAFKFAAALATAQPIPVFRAPGGAELSRDFTYIDDITAGVLGAVDTSPAPPAPHGRPAKPRFRVYNLGNTHPHTVSELVDALEARLGVVGRRVVVRAPPAGDVLATYADIAAAAKVRGGRGRERRSWRRGCRAGLWQRCRVLLRGCCEVHGADVHCVFGVCVCRTWGIDHRRRSRRACAPSATGSPSSSGPRAGRPTCRTRTAWKRSARDGQLSYMYPLALYSQITEVNAELKSATPCGCCAPGQLGCHVIKKISGRASAQEAAPHSVVQLQFEALLAVGSKQQADRASQQHAPANSKARCCGLPQQRVHR